MNKSNSIKFIKSFPINNITKDNLVSNKYKNLRINVSSKNKSKNREYSKENDRKDIIFSYLYTDINYKKKFYI